MTGLLAPPVGGAGMGGGILATGGGGAGYGGLLNAVMQKYGRQALPQMEPQPQQPVDETAMAELLGLIPRQQPPSSPSGIGSPDQIAADPRFNTALTAAEQPAFQAWKQKMAPGDSGYDYDFKGAFKEGMTSDAASGHWSDKFKKPNHETFSVESQYAPQAIERAGYWTGDTYNRSPLDPAQNAMGQAPQPQLYGWPR